MAERGDSAEYRQFLQQPSINMDDSGFFSVQVISKALSVWGLELVNYSSSDPLAVRSRQSPISATAYICNYREHWFTIRRLGSQWFNLNSLLEYPELVSNTYLGEFIAQLQTEGYSIFIVKGQLPDCDADLVLQAVEAVQTRPPRLLSDKAGSGASNTGARTATAATPTSPSAVRDEEADLEAALMLSLAENVPGPAGGPAAIDDNELQRALAMAQGGGEDVEMERALALSQEAVASPQQAQTSEEDDLQQALAMSLAGQPRSPSSNQLPPSASQSSGWGSRLQAQEAEEEERYLMEQQKQQQEEEEELRQALAMSMQTDTKKTVEPPVTNVGGELKHKKLTSPTGQRMDVDQQTKTALSKSAAVPAIKPSPAPKSSRESNSLTKATRSGSMLGNPGTSTASAGALGGSGAAPPSPVRGALAGGPSAASPSSEASMPSTGGHTLGGGQKKPQAGGSGETDPAEIRRRRLAFLEKMQNENKS